MTATRSRLIEMLKENIKKQQLQHNQQTQVTKQDFQSQVQEKDMQLQGLHVSEYKSVQDTLLSNIYL